MFSNTNNRPGFGGNTSTFGAPATANPFGTSQMFGTPSTNFGASPFGQTTTNVFGGQPQPQNQLFGGTNAASFGQQNAFGTTSLFGQTNTAPSTSLFSTPTFGAQNKPSGFSFSTPQSTLFGQNTSQPQQTNVFQSSTIFGQPSTGFGMNVQNGTTIKFQPVTGTDSMQKSGQTSVINTKHHSITCMKEYENKSFEELRFEDYSENRKGPQTAGSFGTSAQPFASAPNTSIFGQTENKPAFGQTNTFGTPAPAFGASTSNSIFGKPFGTTITTASSGFGSSFGTMQQQPTTSIFGGQQQSKPFGQTAPLFGSQPQQSTFGSTFATPAPQQGFFNKPAQPTFSAPQTGGFIFGQTPASTQATGLFPAAKTTGYSLFNNSTTTTTSAWPSTNTFGTNAFAKPAQPAFGQQAPSTFGTGMQMPQTNLFGNLGAKPTFGATTQPSLFGTSTLQTTPSFGLQQQTAPQPVTLNASSQLNDLRSMIANSDPYGYSPHLDNLDAFKPSSTHYVTNPKDIDNYLKQTENNISNTMPKTKKIQVKSPCASEKWKMFESSYENEDANTSVNGTTVNKSIKRLSIRRDPNLKKPEPIFLDKDGRIVEKNSDMNTSITSPPKALQITSPLGRTNNVTTNTMQSPASPATPLNNKQVTELPKSSWMNSLSKTCALEKSTEAERKTPTTTSSRPVGTAEKENQVEKNNAEGNFLSSTEIADTCGVICTRPQYYTVPGLDKLAQYKNPDGTCLIKGFTIGRHGYGNVFFDDLMNVANLNIDELVHFCHKQISIYLDDNTKPSVGDGLNRPAQVTLDRVFPSVDIRSKTTDTAAGDCDDAQTKALADIEFEEVLRRACNRAGTTFVDYRPETGSWVFKVPHFSKYDLLDPDEVDIRREVLKDARKSLESPTSQDAAHQSNEKQPEKHVELPRRGLGGVSDMDVTDFQMDNIMNFDNKTGMDFAENNMTYMVPHMDMKRMFHDTRGASSSIMENEHPSRWEQDRLPKQNMQVMQMKYMFYGDDILGRDKADKMIEEYDLMDTAAPTLDMSEVGTTDLSGQMTDLMDTPKPQVPERFETFVLHNPSKRVPMEKSLLNDRNRSVMDAALFKGRSFRCGWAAGLKLYAVTSPTNISEVLVSQASIEMADPEADPFRDCEHLNKFINLIYEETALQLEHSSSGETIPFFQMIQTRPDERVNGESLLSRIYALSETMTLKYTQNQRMGYYNSIWKLMLAFWDTPTSSTNMEHYRREMFNQWLEHVTEPIINEILGMQVRHTPGENILTYLSGHKIRDAIQTAMSRGFPQLSLQVAQLNSSNLTRYYMQHQLNDWQVTSRLEFVEKDLQKLYMLIAGMVTNNNINILEGMDWMRCLAMYFWYICPSDKNVEYALGFYEDCFEKRGHAAKPYSKYSTIQTTWDILFHIMKLYCNNLNPLEVLLSPQTHTSDPNDYRLCWLLQQVFLSMGVGLVSDECHYQTTTSFATQLEEYEQYKWAIFVLLHMKDTVVRKNLIMGVLDRQLGNMDRELEEYIVNSFHIPASWIHEVKAAKTQLLNMHWQEYKHLCYSDQFSDSHELLIRELAPILVSNHEFDILLSLLEEIEDRHTQITRWKYQGGLILKFIRFWKIMYDFHERQNIPLTEISAIQLELHQLLTYLRSYRANDFKQVVVVAEMSKYCASVYTTLMKHMSGLDQYAYEFNNQFNMIIMPFDYKYSEINKLIGYSRKTV